MSNRTCFVFRKVVQNFNRVVFLKNKSNYVNSIINNRKQNYNKMIIRKNHTYKPPLSFNSGNRGGNEGGNGGGGGGGKGPSFIFAAAIGVYISQKLTNGKKAY